MYRVELAERLQVAVLLFGQKLDSDRGSHVDGSRWRLPAPSVRCLAPSSDSPPGETKHHPLRPGGATHAAFPVTGIMRVLRPMRATWPRHVTRLSKYGTNCAPNCSRSWSGVATS